MTDDAIRKTQALMAAINQCSIAARVQAREPLTVDFAALRITRGDRVMALAALGALKTVGLLIEVEENGRRVYRLADE